MSSPNHSPYHPFVKRLAAHSHLPEEEQAALHGLPMRIEQVSPNRDFVKLGQEVDHACYIVEGLAGRFAQTEDGARQIISLHIPGDMADLQSVVLANSTLGLQSLTFTTIARVRHSDLRRVANQYPAIAEALWRECSIDAAVLAQWVINVGRRDSKKRMAHLLCEMAIRYGASLDNGSSFQFPLTQNQLGDVAAMTPVHINRTLKSLREEGLANMHFRTVQIMDWDRLRSEGDFDPSYLGAARTPANSYPTGDRQTSAA